MGSGIWGMIPTGSFMILSVREAHARSTRYWMRGEEYDSNPTNWNRLRMRSSGTVTGVSTRTDIPSG